MPAIHEKAKVLEGRGVVVSYTQDTTCYYYRELIQGTKSYRNKKIEGATNLEEAKRLAVVTALEVSGKLPDKKKRSGSKNKRDATESIEDAVDGFIKYEQQRLDADIIKFKTFKAKRDTLRLHLIPYLHSEGVRNTREIKDTTFHNYLIFRKGMKKLTWKSEIIRITDFINNHLLKHRLIDPAVASSKSLFPKFRILQDDLLANPPISKHDWAILNKQIRRWVKDGSNNPNHRAHLWRVLFWTYTLVAKQSGGRPEELMKLKWKDVEVRDVGRISATKLENEIAELEAEGIDVVGEEEAGSAWARNPMMLGREERLIAYITLTSGKTHQYREVPTNLGSVFVRWRDYLNAYYDRHNLNHSVSAGDLVFANVNNDFRPYSHNHFHSSWKFNREAVKDQLEGNKFSDEHYTIYSMRGTMIQDKLLEGLDIFLLSRISGHSPDVLLRYYDRLDIRERAEEITSLSFGKHSKEDVKVELYSNR